MSSYKRCRGDTLSGPPIARKLGNGTQSNFTVRRPFGRTEWISMLFLLVGILLLGALPAHAHGTPAAPKYVTLPVYYLTDRNLEGDTYGNHRRYQSNCLHQMYYGTASVTVENHKQLQPGQLSESLNWKFTEQRPKGKYNNDQIDPSRPVAAKREFFSRLKKALDQASTDQLCVYVHGAEEGFEDACDDAAELAYTMHRPLVLYSWPSEPKLLDYVVDNGNNEWSQGHFNIFCRNLLAFKETHPLHLIMSAHSMGNRFLFRSMRFLYESQLISDCEFVSPDMDIDTCRHYVMGFRRIDFPTSMRLYVSNKDKMLKLSQKIFGGYARLGEDVQSHLVPGRNVEELIVRKDSGQKEEKSKSAEAEQAAVSEPNETREENTGGEVLERIDFTAIDQGFTGHSFPFQLVADMVDGKKPEGGIEVVEDKTDKTGHPLKVIKSLSGSGADSKRD